MIRISKKTLQELIWPLLQEVILTVFRALDFEFLAGDYLSQIKHISELGGYTASFYEAYFKFIGT